MNNYAYKNNGYYQNRPQYNQQRRQDYDNNTNYSTQVNNLNPNEIKISNKGNLYTYSNIVFNLIKRDGFQCCKLVGRGTASEKAMEVMRHLKSRDP